MSKGPGVDLHLREWVKCVDGAWRHTYERDTPRVGAITTIAFATMASTTFLKQS